MKVLLGSLVLVLAVASAYAEEPSAYNYHQRIGIPDAVKIRRAEEDAALAGLPGQRIVGGTNVDISQVPYQVSAFSH